MHIQAGTVIGGIDALQAAVAAGVHQAAEVHQPLVAEEQLGGGAVEADDQDLHGSSELPSMAGPLGTPRAVEDGGGQVHEPRRLAAERAVHEQDAGDQRGIDDVIAAPRLHVVLEVPLGHPAHRRAPRDAIARGEVDDQVGRLAGEGARVELLAGPHAPDGDGIPAGVAQAAQAPRDGRLHPLGLVGGDDPLLLATLEVQVDPPQAQRVGLRPRPVDVPQEVAGLLARPGPRAAGSSRPLSWSHVFRWTPRRKLLKP